ncbi:MAG TPA: SAM-dependent chlorinase/fluorinase [Spirochaetota bacterium]|nr:SAM-dependent chlorinase/fluorinase [Spirochaetota bacterium]
MRRTVTFTSDFGYHDTYVAEVRGVIEACAPSAHVIDLTHGIGRGDLLACSFVLLSSYSYFEESSVHLAVVDPGVGTERGILAVETGEYTFVGPDNGILYEAANSSGVRCIFEVDPERLRSKAKKIFTSRVAERVLGSDPSSTFHGRDIFAPLVGYIVAGAPMEEIGSATGSTAGSMERVEITGPDVREDQIVGSVIYVDRFGNLITNVGNKLVGPDDELFLKAGGKLVRVGKIRRTYAEAPPGLCISVTGSRGYVEIAVNGGSAKQTLGACTGDDILVLRG